jgi:RIO kinase 1
LRLKKNGKKAAVDVVLSEGEVRCAKAYKAANKRGFHKQTLYQEGEKYEIADRLVL